MIVWENASQKWGRYGQLREYRAEVGRMHVGGEWARVFKILEDSESIGGTEALRPKASGQHKCAQLFILAFAWRAPPPRGGAILSN